MSEAINRILAQNVVDKESGELLESVQVIPPGKLIELAVYFAENLLPRIEINKGRDSLDYENMLTAVNAIMYCLVLLEKWESAEKKLQQSKYWAKIMSEQNLKLEAELSKYTAIENAMTSGTLELYQQVLRKKGIDVIQDILRQYGNVKKP